MSAPGQMGVQADLPAERAVLGAILLDNAALDELGDLLTPADFYSWSNGAVYEAVCSVHARGEPVDLVTVRAELAATKQLERAGGDEALLALNEALPNVDAVETYAKRVRQLATVRAMVTEATRIASRGREPIEDVDAYLDEAEAALHAVAMARRADQRCRRLKDLVIEVFEDITKRPEHGEVRGVATGIRLLDTTLSGLRPQHLVIVAGRPGMGKTAFALHVLLEVARAGGPVLGWSGEMAGTEWAERTVVAESGVEGDVVRAGGHGQGSGFSPNEWAKLTSAAGALARLPVEIDDTPSISLWQLRSKARRMRAREGLALIIVDYLQLMRSGERQASREQEVAAVSRGLKALAKELEVPVMALSQLNRSVESRSDKRPTMADLRESGQVEQDADAILFLYREGYYDEEASRTVAEINVAKQRGGRTATIKAFFDPDVMRWANLANDEAPSDATARRRRSDDADDPADFRDDDGGWR